MSRFRHEEEAIEENRILVGSHRLMLLEWVKDGLIICMTVIHYFSTAAYIDQTYI